MLLVDIGRINMEESAYEIVVIIKKKYKAGERWLLNLKLTPGELKYARAHLGSS